MIESEKKFRELQHKLSTENYKTVSGAIISLRNEVPFKGAISLLTALYDRTNDPEIKNLITNFLNDIKEPEARYEIVKAVMNNFKPETLSMLVSSCWQSGLDYSGFIIDFTKLFIKGDYLTALECFTVIEESVQRIPAGDKSKVTGLLEKNKNKLSIEKIPLFQTLISILS
jgi:hypothetical protein